MDLSTDLHSIQTWPRNPNNLLFPKAFSSFFSLLGSVRISPFIHGEETSLKITPLWSVMGYVVNGVSYFRGKLLLERLYVTYYFPVGVIHWLKAFFVIAISCHSSDIQKVINIELEDWKWYSKWNALGSKSTFWMKLEAYRRGKEKNFCSLKANELLITKYYSFQI